MVYAAIASLLIWAFIFVLPWRPWSTKEQWDPHTVPESGNNEENLSEITVLIPARNEETVIGHTLESVCSQGDKINIIVVDDNSEDKTADVANGVDSTKVSVVSGSPTPEAWSGKLWALEQGLRLVETPVVVLLDADIKLQEGVIKGLLERLRIEKYDFISLMAQPALSEFWEKFLMPAFIYFFKLLYPFKLANSKSGYVAAAAGGCIMTYKNVLMNINGFSTLRGALIDDCTLAREVKKNGYRTWLGLTHSAISIRPYQGVRGIWNMVARTAYTQLFHSFSMLIGCTILMIITFAIPPVALFASGITLYLGAGAYIVMSITYLPILTYYNQSYLWSLLMPVIGVLYLLMTWTSAIRYWLGEEVRWRGRIKKRR